VDFCPHDVFEEKDGKPVVANPEECVDFCKGCQKGACDYEAISYKQVKEEVKMGKKGLIMCVCQGTCPSFGDMNTMEVLNAIRRENIVDFVALHPQLCADDGDAFLETILSDKIDSLYVAGCDPKMQTKMFKDAFSRAGYDIKNMYSVDIRNQNTEQVIASIEKLVGEYK